jgi:hypothetical protein
MSQHKYNVYGFGRRKSRHMGAPIPKEISSSIYASSMSNALGQLLGELKGYEIERVEVVRVYTVEEARGPAVVHTMLSRADAEEAAGRTLPVPADAVIEQELDVTAIQRAIMEAAQATFGTDTSLSSRALATEPQEGGEEVTEAAATDLGEGELAA